MFWQPASTKQRAKRFMSHYGRIIRPKGVLNRKEANPNGKSVLSNDLPRRFKQGQNGTLGVFDDTVASVAGHLLGSCNDLTTSAPTGGHGEV